MRSFWAPRLDDYLTEYNWKVGRDVLTDVLMIEIKHLKQLKLVWDSASGPKLAKKSLGFQDKHQNLRVIAPLF